MGFRMIRSMTAFAAAERATEGGTLAAELRAVNHRYLELSLRMPEELRSLENDARQLLTTTLRRGKVDAGLYLRSTSAAPATLEINRALLEQLLQRAAEVEKLAGGAHGAVNALDLLRWPGVVREAERDLAPNLGYNA